MEEKLYTLDELWKMAGEKQFEAEQLEHDDAGWNKSRIFGRSSSQTEFVTEQFVSSGHIRVRYEAKDTRIWRPHVPAPKLAAHYPAVCGRPGEYWLADSLYTPEDDANACEANFIRLATEYPPVMLEVK
jgi:hypothetical protein